MSGRGETPKPEPEAAVLELSLGQTLYDEAGEEVGEIRGFEEGGVYVTTREGVEALSVEHARSGHSFGEATLMWRCLECGEMGRIDDGVPDICPNCGRGRENLEYWKED